MKAFLALFILVASDAGSPEHDKGPVSRASGVASHTTVLLQDGSFKSGGCNTIATRQSANDSPNTIAKTPAHIGAILFPVVLMMPWPA
jgi:hypothetical protein